MGDKGFGEGRTEADANQMKVKKCMEFTSNCCYNFVDAATVSLIFDLPNL